jgi:hypothetical protein
MIKLSLIINNSRYRVSILQDDWWVVWFNDVHLIMLWFHNFRFSASLSSSCLGTLTINWLCISLDYWWALQLSSSSCFALDSLDNRGLEVLIEGQIWGFLDIVISQHACVQAILVLSCYLDLILLNPYRLIDALQIIYKQFISSNNWLLWIVVRSWCSLDVSFYMVSLSFSYSDGTSTWFYWGTTWRLSMELNYSGPSPCLNLYRYSPYSSWWSVVRNKLTFCFVIFLFPSNLL